MQYIFQFVEQQISVLILINLLAFVFFEIFPLILKKENTIAKNFNDLLLYQFGMSIFSIVFGVLIFFGFYKVGLVKEFINLRDLPLFVQVVIVYLTAEFFIYASHLSAHKLKIPLVTKSHYFHHTVTDDLQWVNSKKEHPFIIFLFILVFNFVFYTIFGTSTLVKVLCVNIFIFLHQNRLNLIKLHQISKKHQKIEFD